MKDPYKTLKVNRSASVEEIRQAWVALVQQYHPDKNPGCSKAEARFKQVQAAWELLRDPQRRERFDRTGDTSEPKDGEVESLLCTLLDGVLKECAGRMWDLRQLDLVAKLRAELEGRRSGTANAVRELRRIKEDLAAIVGRFIKVAGEPEESNVLDGYVRGRLNLQEEQLKKAEARLALLDRALVHLQLFGYKVDTLQGAAVATTTSMGLAHLQIVVGRGGEY